MKSVRLLSESEFQEVENKVRAKLGEKLKTNRILREEVLEIVEQEATLLKYPIPDDELCAFVCKKKDHTFVYINTHLPKERQVFAAAHELYHIWYDQDILDRTELLQDHTLENDTDDLNEWKANLFAALLLVPTEVLSNEIKSRGLDKREIGIEDIVKLMSLFFVPYKTIVRRLYEVGSINDQELTMFLSIPDRDPKEGVMLRRKRMQIRDQSQERTGEIFFEGLVERAIAAYEEKKITEDRLRYLLSLIKESPESMQLIEAENSCDEWDRIMEDYDGED